MSDARSRATAIVASLGGEAQAPGATPNELIPLVYDELRGLARGFLARERPDHTLQATALVHEAYLRLIDQTRVDWRGRTHFRAIAARMMRRVLIDHARHRAGAKRGAGWRRVTLGDSLAGPADPELDLAELIGVDVALRRLAERDPRQARCLELRFFGGLMTREIAEAVGVSTRTVEGDLLHGRAWLRRELSRKGGS